MLLPVEPFPCWLSRSRTNTFVQPASHKCQAMLDPTIPPPMMTTSAVSMYPRVQSRESEFQSCALYSRPIETAPASRRDRHNQERRTQKSVPTFQLSSRGPCGHTCRRSIPSLPSCRLSCPSCRACLCSKPSFRLYHGRKPSCRPCPCSNRPSCRLSCRHSLYIRSCSSPRTSPYRRSMRRTSSRPPPRLAEPQPAPSWKWQTLGSTLGTKFSS